MTLQQDTHALGQKACTMHSSEHLKICSAFLLCSYWPNFEEKHQISNWKYFCKDNHISAYIHMHRKSILLFFYILNRKG